MKLQNIFSQNQGKGQLVLFGQDVVEVAEQLPLPLCNAGLVITAESLKNLHISFIYNIKPLDLITEESQICTVQDPLKLKNRL